ncbi:MAG: NADPH:quinone reductase-like Zn-dependent oxidoreductase, partial [Cryomorphaceae bacterium]
MVKYLLVLYRLVQIKNNKMNKSILITGANSGLGKDTARQLGL